MTQSNSDNRKKTVVIVALLLALVLLLGIGGYTLAKYITSGSGDGTATVAKWGYTVNVDTSNLFGKNYKATAIQSDDAEKANLDVASSSDAKVVAPGTTGSMTIKVAGKAEVAAKLNIAIENADDISLTLGENVYHPVKWTLNDGESDLVTDGTLADVKTALEVKDQTIEIGTELNKTYTLSWKWDFENAANFNDIAIDTLDTALGQLASDQVVTSVKKATDNTDVAITASNLTVKFTVKVSIEQIQKAN